MRLISIALLVGLGLGNSNAFAPSTRSAPSSAAVVQQQPPSQTTTTTSNTQLFAEKDDDNSDDILKPKYEIEPLPLRVGHGFDIHRMAPLEEAGQPVVIGGVTIPHKDQKVSKWAPQPESKSLGVECMLSWNNIVLSMTCLNITHLHWSALALG